MVRISEPEIALSALAQVVRWCCHNLDKERSRRSRCVEEAKSGFEHVMIKASVRSFHGVGA